MIDPEIVAALEGAEDRARELALVLHEHGRRQMFWIRIDCIAEQQQLDDRDADDHRIGQPVADELCEFLGEHGHHSR